MSVYTLVPAPQRSPEWFQARLGRVTGSKAKDVLATIKTGEAASRRDYRVQLVLERLTGTSQGSTYVNAAMQWGTDHEADAVAAYEAHTGLVVTPVGFCRHNTLMAGTSPDGVVGAEGSLSVKCPESANHLRMLQDGIEPKEHTAQNTHEMWLLGRPWLDFMSYDPRLPGTLQIFIVRVTRTPLQLLEYEAAVKKFLAEVDTEEAALRTMADLKGQLQASA